METTVTNGGGMRASQLAEKAARAVGDGETAAVELAAVSLALSMASLAGSAAVLAEQARPVPLAAADTLPDEPATPFVRSVDELTDDDFIKPYQLLTGHARAWIGPHDMARARAFYDAIAARLRVDGPGREPEPAEIAAAMLDAAPVGWLVADNDSDDWANIGSSLWRHRGGAECLSEGLLNLYGPLTNLRPPSGPKPAPAEATPVTEAWSKDEAYDTRDALTAAALRAAAEWFDKSRSSMELLASQGSANADLDAAAREHVTALGGPATGGVIATPGFAVTDEDVESFFAAQRGSGQTSLHEWDRRAMEHFARRLAGRLPLASTSYDPSTLSVGSVVVASGRVYVKSEYENSVPWLVVPLLSGVGFGRYLANADVPTDGVLVVDGATLGGGQ